MLTSRHTRTPLSLTDDEPKPERTRVMIALAVYGGALGAAALLINLLSRTQFPQIPEHMTPVPTAYMSGGAFVFCAVLGVLAARWAADKDDPLRSLLKWLVFGFGFGVLAAPLTGASLPVSTVFLGLHNGIISAGEMPMQLMGALFKMPSFGFTHGVFGLFTSLLAGALFGIGGWLISSAAYSPFRWLSTYGPIAIAIALSALFYGISVLAPAPTLARLG